MIRIAAALLLRRDGGTLLVRKRGTVAFMQPGGKIELGETPIDALRRELREELGLDIEPDRAEPLGRFDSDAANEPGHRVRAALFGVWTDRSVRPDAEIEQLEWIDPSRPCTLALAPLTRDHVLPLWRALVRSDTRFR